MRRCPKAYAAGYAVLSHGKQPRKESAGLDCRFSLPCPRKFAILEYSSLDSLVDRLDFAATFVDDWSPLQLQQLYFFFDQKILWSSKHVPIPGVVTSFHTFRSTFRELLWRRLWNWPTSNCQKGLQSLRAMAGSNWVAACCSWGSDCCKVMVFLGETLVWRSGWWSVVKSHCQSTNGKTIPTGQYLLTRTFTRSCLHQCHVHDGLVGSLSCFETLLAMTCQWVPCTNCMFLPMESGWIWDVGVSKWIWDVWIWSWKFPLSWMIVCWQSGFPIAKFCARYVLDHSLLNWHVLLF